MVTTRHAPTRHPRQDASTGGRQGSISSPAGGGHWLIVVGITASHVIVHDPLGEADLVTGTTIDGTARFCRYSRQNFGRRWMVEGDGSGWAVLAQG